MEEEVNQNCDRLWPTSWDQLFGLFKGWQVLQFDKGDKGKIRVLYCAHCIFWFVVLFKLEISG
jgi:hypothetical protein